MVIIKKEINTININIGISLLLLVFFHTHILEFDY